MGPKDFLVDAVAQFLQTSEWQDAITQFFAAHCAAFPLESADEKQSKGGGYTLEQYELFTQFKDLMERLLENMMHELGCRGEDLLAILEESVRNGPTGERRFLIKTLLSLEDYEDFYARITEYQTQYGGGRDEDASTERGEWEMQLAVAQSLLDANARGLLDESEQSFLPWAEALVGMGHSNPNPVPTEEVDASSESKEVAAGAPNELTEPVDERLKELEYTLIKERLKVDLLVAQRIAESNAAMKRDMLHLTAAEVLLSEEQENGSAEQTLESLFAQLETVRDRLKVVKANCFTFKNVSQEAMDKMYLFLKEKIHYQQDLVSQEKDISDFVFTLVDQSDAALIPLLLEWLLLESEALRVQSQIQDELGQSVSDTTGGTDGDGFWTQSWDENAQAFFYFHSVTGESVWEPPSVGYYDANQEYQWPSPTTYESAEAKDTPHDESERSDAITNLDQAASALKNTISDSSPQRREEMFEMERVLERISREHDEERKRLELVFELEKARQKEELRRRKEKKRKERNLKKKRKEDCERENPDDIKAGEDKTTDGCEGGIASEPLPPAPTAEALMSGRAEAKRDDGPENQLSISVPGRGRIQLAHLLSEEHARRQLEKNGLTVPLAPAPQALLNPTSLRYLAESLAKKHVAGFIDESPKSVRQAPRTEIVVEDADEK